MRFLYFMKTLKIPVFCIISTLIIGGLSLASSLLGLFNPAVYQAETANWALQAKGQDIGNLIALPFLLISAFYLTKNSQKAYFLWLGSLFYYLYAYLIYAYALHFNFLFLVYVAVLGLCFYTLVLGLANSGFPLNPPHNFKTNFASFFLILLGILFSILWLGDLLPALFAGTVPKDLAAAGLWVNPVHVVDLSVVLPGMVLTGFLFQRKSRFGSLFLFPWLVFSVLMGASIMALSLLSLVSGDKSALMPLIFVGLIVAGSKIVLLINYRNLSS